MPLGIGTGSNVVGDVSALLVRQALRMDRCRSMPAAARRVIARGFPCRLAPLIQRSPSHVDLFAGHIARYSNPRKLRTNLCSDITE